MKKKLLTTTLLSMSLLSLNLFAGSKIKCTGAFCMVDLSTISPKSKQEGLKKEIIVKADYKTVLINNMETIIFPHEKYVMTEDEVAEYDLKEMKKNLLIPSLTSDNLPNSDYLCEDDLKAVEVAGIENTYECT